MEHKDFDAVLTARVDKIETVLSSKAEEYAPGKDHLHNFKAAAAAKGESPEKALWGMYMKHWVAVQDMVKHPERVTLSMVDEKIGDSINYHILLEALFLERFGLYGKR